MENCFKIVKVAENQFQVFYRVDVAYCKRLDYDFSSEEQAAAAVLVLEYWLDHGGKIMVAGDPDSPDVITGFDSRELQAPAVTTVALIRCFVTQGVCDKELVQALLGLDEQMLEPYILPIGSNLNLVDLARLLKDLAFEHHAQVMADEQEGAPQQIAVDDQCQHLILLHRSLQIQQLIEEAITEGDQQTMFIEYMRGYPMNVIGKQHGISYLDVRKQLAKAKTTFDRFMGELVTAKEQLKAVTAELMQARQELKDLRSCFVVREVAKSMPEKPTPEFYEWATFTLKELFVSLDRFPFTLRASKSLEMLGVSRVDQLLSLNFQTLQQLPNIGSKTCDELQEFIREHHLDMLDNPAVIKVLRKMAEEGFQKACERFGLCPVVKTGDGFILYDGFEFDDELDMALQRIFSHPSLLRKQPVIAI